MMDAILSKTPPGYGFHGRTEAWPAMRIGLHASRLVSALEAVLANERESSSAPIAEELMKMIPLLHELERRKAEDDPTKWHRYLTMHAWISRLLGRDPEITSRAEAGSLLSDLGTVIPALPVDRRTMRLA